MSAGKIVLLVFGAILLLISIGMVFGGGALVWVNQTFSDSEGFLTTDTITLESGSYAITTHPADIDFKGWWPWGWDNFATVKIEGTNNHSATPIFIGIADEANVIDYVMNVNYDEIKEFRIHPDELKYINHPGSTVPDIPSDQTFWETSVYGSGTQTLEWEIQEGTWVLVLMNNDGSPGIDVSGVVGIKVPWIFGIGLGFLVGGIVLLIISIVIIVLVSRRSIRDSGTMKSATGSQAPPQVKPPHPLILTGELTEPLSQWLWLVKWFLLIPHYVVLAFLWIASAVLWFLSIFAILFTSRYPRSFFDFNVGVLRWTWRVNFYGYMALGTDKYPPFTLKAGGYPADLEIPYPEKLSKGLVLVKWWLLAFPHYIVLALLWGFGSGWGRWMGLNSLLVLFAAIVLLFTGRYHQDIYKLVMGINRWGFRVIAYSELMTDCYPPFKLTD